MVITDIKKPTTDAINISTQKGLSITESTKASTNSKQIEILLRNFIRIEDEKRQIKINIEKEKEEIENYIDTIPKAISISNGQLEKTKEKLTKATKNRISKSVDTGIKSSMVDATKAVSDSIIPEMKSSLVGGTFANASNIPQMVPITVTPEQLENHDEYFRYKIMMSDFFDDDQIKDELILRNKSLYKNKIFNSKEFDSITDKNAGVIGPDAEIKKLIDNIGKNENTFENIIKNHPDYLHNRVGTLLNDSEKKNLIKNKKDFDSGDLVSYNDGLNEKFVIYMNTILDGDNSGKMKIIKINRNNKKNITVEIEIVDSASLSYINDEIKQVFKANLKLSDDDLIETYTIDF